MTSNRRHVAGQDQNFSDVDRPRLLAELARQVPAGNLLSDAEDLKPYECDGLSAFRQVPLAVVLVENEVLTQIGSGARNRRWQAPDVLRALDNFSDRIARR